MKLATPVQFGKYVKPVCLPNQGENVPVGTECYITGKHTTWSTDTSKPPLNIKQRN